MRDERVTAVAELALNRRWVSRFLIALCSIVGRITVGAIATFAAEGKHRRARQPRRNTTQQGERRNAGGRRGKKRRRRSCAPPLVRCRRRCCRRSGGSGDGSCSPPCPPGETCIGGNCRGERCGPACTTSTCGVFPGGCPLFPTNNVWNRTIDTLPTLGNSAEMVAAIGAGASLHPDFGAGLYDGGPIGIPFVTVPANQPLVPIAIAAYPDESDPGPYPIPPDAPVEGGICRDGDRHVLVVQSGTCQLYELYQARSLADGSWAADSAAHFDLNGNQLRPAGWTSADAAGLPILPGLVRYEEVATGTIDHALRFTAQPTRTGYVWPARHQAGATSDTSSPPMGQRFRLEAAFDLSGFSAANRVILTALKTYGMILADNGGDWFLSGAPDERWDNDDLNELKSVHGSDFEAVDCSSLMVDPDSAAAR